MHWKHCKWMILAKNISFLKVYKMRKMIGTLYNVYDLIHHAIKKEEMDDKYIIASATGTESVLVI